MRMTLMLTAAFLFVAGAASGAEPVPVGSSYAVPGMSNSVATIIDPNDNRKGVILRTCWAYAVANSGTSIHVSTVPPVITTPLSTKTILFVEGFGQQEQLQMPHPLFVPAGFGIYAAAAPGNGSVVCTYDVQ